MKTTELAHSPCAVPPRQMNLPCGALQTKPDSVVICVVPYRGCPLFASWWNTCDIYARVSFPIEGVTILVTQQLFPNKSLTFICFLSLYLTASMSRNITLEKHSKHKIPPHFWETPLIFGKPFPGPKRVTDMTPKKKPCSEIYRPPLFCKKKRVQFGIVWPRQLHF